MPLRSAPLSRAASLYLLCLFAITPPPPLHAEQLPVLHPEGVAHGFLVGRTPEGRIIASGDLLQTAKGDRVSCRLVFHFRDGSVDDDQFVFRQDRTFSLLSDHHIQKGPSFPKPIDISVDVASGNVLTRTFDNGIEKIETTHMDLPPDLSNGVVLSLLKNIAPGTPATTVSYLAATPKPRVVKLVITPAGEESFSVAGARHKATRFDLKVELGGLAGVVAPLIGKQPKDNMVWIAGGEAPAFVKAEGPLYVGGPLWIIEMSSPTWSRSRAQKSAAAH